MYPKKTKRWKKLLTWGLISAISVSSINGSKMGVYAVDKEMLKSNGVTFAAENSNTENQKKGAVGVSRQIYSDGAYNYAKLLQYSLYFYDANMCGELENSCSVNWRKNCHLKDKTVNYNGKTVDVSGGFHDAGDHDKFGLPQGYSATVLGMGYYEYKDAYLKTGQSQHFKKILDYFCDYFTRCTVLDGSGNAEAFCYQVGDGGSHNLWVSPEEETIDRPAYFADASTPATDQVSEAAAALALQYLNFGNENYLDTAKKLFAMAMKNEKKKQDSQGGNFYSSSSWEDDYCLAATWLYKATGDSVYQQEYKKYEQNLKIYGWPAWDDVGAYAKAYGSNDWDALSTNVTSNKNSCKTIDNCYSWLCQWGSARYNCNMQLEGLIYDKYKNSNDYTNWSQSQMNFLLGNSSTKQCYVVGYNDQSTKYPHHRAASGYGKFPNDGCEHAQQAHVLIGALAGGITDDKGSYNDSSADYYSNEVAIDYNAAMTGAAAALYLKNINDGNQKIVKSGDSDAPKEIKTYYDGSGDDTPSEPIEVKVEDVEMNPKVLELEEGESKTLNVTVKPENAANKAVRYEVTDENVASVTQDGKVTAKKAGTTQIIVHTEDGNKTATCDLTVKESTVAVTGIKLQPQKMELEEGEKQSLEVSIEPENATNKVVRYEVADESIVSVTKNGQVTAKKAGTTEITVHTEDGDKTATCEVTVKKKQVEVTGVRIEPNILELTEGESDTLEAIVEPEDADDKTVTWSSEDTSVATVKDGKVTAKKAGTVKITAKAGEKEGTCTVTVKEKEPEIIEVMGIKLYPDKLELEEDESDTLTVKVEPENATNQKVRYEVEDENVAVVSKEGKVTAKKAGTTQIIVHTEDGDKTAVCEVTVKKKPEQKIEVTGIKLQPDKLELEEDESDTLTVKVEPENATNQKVRYEVEDESVAVVSKEGKVTAKKAGTTQIIVHTEDGDKTAVCEVSVKKKKTEEGSQNESQVRVKGVNITPEKLKMKFGNESFQLIAEVIPENADNKKVTWENDSPNIVYVSETGEVTPLRTGTAKITVHTEDGDKTATCEVTVEKKTEQVIKVDSVKITEKEISLKQGQTKKLKAEISPENATDQTVTWESADKEVATVDSDGTVHAVGEGETDIIASTSNGKQAKAVVKVEKEAEEQPNVSIFMTSNVTLQVNDAIILQAVVENAEKNEIEWKSDNPEIVFVKNGALIGKKEGTATVTASITKNGKTVSADCKVTVVKKEETQKTVLTISDTLMVISVGEKNKINYTVFPDSASEQEITWTVENPDIVSVLKDGTVVAKNSGVTEITGNIKNTDAYANCIVKVVNPTEVQKVEKITLNKTDITLQRGEEDRLYATVIPENATNPGIKWKSENPEIAYVDDSGRLIAISKGVATITATAEDGSNVAASCTVTVIEKKEKPVESLNVKTSVLKLNVKKTATIKVNIKPEDATNKTLLFKSNAKKVVRIVSTTQNSVKIQAMKPGIAKLTITSASNQAVYKTVIVQVKPEKVSKLKASSIKKNKLKLSWKKAGNVSGYKVYYSTSKSGGYKLYKTAKTNNITVSGLKNKKTYYFKVKAYKKDTLGTVYGKESGVYKVKTAAK